MANPNPNPNPNANPNPKQAKPTMNESMLYTNLSGALIAGALAVATGHLSDGIAFCNRHPGVPNLKPNHDPNPNLAPRAQG